jgi:hypothetical protein
MPRTDLGLYCRDLLAATRDSHSLLLSLPGDFFERSAVAVELGVGLAGGALRILAASLDGCRRDAFPNGSLPLKSSM